MGARPLRRTIQREIEDALSERILFNELRPGQIIQTDTTGDPTDTETTTLTFTGSDKKVPQVPQVPQLVPAELDISDLGDLGDAAEVKE
jgi:ATP-dependent Clp protease ATP-binding subunit ClpC